MLFIAPSVFQDSSFEVLSVDRKVSLAFRLGSEVVDTLVVRRDDKKYTITLSMQHTICGPVKMYSVGNKLTIKKSEIHDGEIVRRDLVKISK